METKKDALYPGYVVPAGAARQGGITSEENGAGDLPSPPAPEHWYYCCGEAKPTDGYTLEQLYDYARAAIASYLARQPKAEQPRPTDDDLWDATLRDRDTYHEWADKLAEAIATYFGAEIGEHSNMNCPWHEALEVIECAAPVAPASAQNAAPHVSFSNAGRYCMSEDDCIEAGVKFSSYERGVADAIEACERTAKEAASKAGAQNAEAIRNAALGEAADKLEQMNDSSGDAAAYDQREQNIYELEREHAISDCVKAIRALQSGIATTKTGDAE